MNSIQIGKRITAYESEISRLVEDREILLNSAADAEEEGTEYDSRKLANLGTEIQDRREIVKKLRERLAVVIAEEENLAREGILSEIVESGTRAVDTVKKAIKKAIPGVESLLALVEVIGQACEQYGATKAKLPIDGESDYDELLDLIGGRNRQKLLNFGPHNIIEFLQSLQAHLEKIDFPATADYLRSANEAHRLRLKHEKEVVEKRENDLAAFVAERNRRAELGASEPQENKTVNLLEIEQA